MLFFNDDIWSRAEEGDALAMVEILEEVRRLAHEAVVQEGLYWLEASAHHIKNIDLKNGGDEWPTHPGTVRGMWVAAVGMAAEAMARRLEEVLVRATLTQLQDSQHSSLLDADLPTVA